MGDLDNWQKFIGLVGVPTFLLTLVLVGIYRLAMRLGKPLVDGLLDFFKSLIAELKGFSTQLLGVGQKVDAAHAKNEQRFTVIETDLDTIKDKLERPT